MPHSCTRCHTNSLTFMAMRGHSGVGKLTRAAQCALTRALEDANRRNADLSGHRCLNLKLDTDAMVPARGGSLRWQTRRRNDRRRSDAPAREYEIEHNAPLSPAEQKHTLAKGNLFARRTITRAERPARHRHASVQSEAADGATGKRGRNGRSNVMARESAQVKIRCLKFMTSGRKPHPIGTRAGRPRWIRVRECRECMETPS